MAGGSIFVISGQIVQRLKNGRSANASLIDCIVAFMEVCVSKVRPNLEGSDVQAEKRSDCAGCSLSRWCWDWTSDVAVDDKDVRDGSRTARAQMGSTTGAGEEGPRRGEARRAKGGRRTVPRSTIYSSRPPEAYVG